MLDRKVIYEIKEGGPELTCGRRNKKSEHKLQLGGSGMQPDHCSFLKVEDGCLLKPLCEAAIKQIRVNGKPLESIEGIVI